MKWERWGAATGFVAFALGAAAALFERGAPGAKAPAEEVAAFFSDYRVELLVQSLLFVLSAGAWLWFLGSLRSYLLRAEGGVGMLSMVAFGAGVVGIGIQALIQAPQSALAMASSGSVEPGLALMMANMAYAFNVIAYVPLAVMLVAVALDSLRTGAFPKWLEWLSAVAATALLIMSAGDAVNTPLAAGAWPTYVPYALMAAWLLATSSVMTARIGKPPTSVAIPDAPNELVEQATPLKAG